MDYFDALLGDPSDSERLREVARQLRRREAYGMLGAASGDPVLGQMGAGMVQQAGQRADRLQKAREAAEMRDFRRGEAERKAQQWGATARPLGEGFYEQGGDIQQLPGYAEARERSHRRALEKAMAAAQIRSQVSAQEFRDREAYKRSFIPEATWRGPKGVAQGMAQVEALGSLVGPMTQAEDLSLPGADVVNDILNDVGLGGAVRLTEPMYRTLDTRQLRSSLENILTRIRNSMFGAALTRYEGGRYEKVSPLAPGLEKDEMVSRTKNLAEYLRNEAKTLVAGRKTPTGEPMPTFLEQGWKWEDSSGQKEEAPQITGVDTGTRATFQMPPGWKVEVE